MQTRPRIDSVTSIVSDANEAVADWPRPIWLSTQVSAPSPQAMIDAPTMSKRRASGRSAGANLKSSAIAMTASGGLIQNTACHPNCWVNQPPSTGPAALVNDDAAAHTPIAAARSSLG